MDVKDPRMVRVLAALDTLDTADKNFLRSSLPGLPQELKEEAARKNEAEERSAKRISHRWQAPPTHALSTTIRRAHSGCI